MGFKDDMQEFDEEFEAAKDAPRPGGVQLDDGRHQVQITEARVDHDESDDTYTGIVRFQNTNGSIRKWYNFDHEVGRSIAAQDFKMMGYEGKLSDVEEWFVAEEPIGLICDIGIKTKPGTERDYTNVYLNRVMGKAELQDFGAGGATAGVGIDDDIPF